MREKGLAEDKAKKVALLEAEMRALRASVDEAALKFDEALQVDKGRELGGKRGRERGAGRQRG